MSQLDSSVVSNRTEFSCPVGQRDRSPFIVPEQRDMGKALSRDRLGLGNPKLDQIFRPNLFYQIALLASKQLLDLTAAVHCISFIAPKQGPSPPGTFHVFIGKFSYFIIRFY